MGRAIHKLSAKEVENERRTGYHADGGGLYLQVSRSGTKSWIFRYKLAGITLSNSGKTTAREMGLGPLHTVPLAEARRKASQCRRFVIERIDPLEARKAGQAREALSKERSPTFSDCTVAYIKAHRASWKNAKHAAQWENTLATYCEPVFGSTSVRDVDTGLILKALEPIWNEKRETASRVRGRAEKVLDWAKVRGYRSGDNPARWRGHLDQLLPRIRKKHRVRHHPALPFAEVSEFMHNVRAQRGVAARALEFTILCAARTNEVIA
jgi:hypothetical protein